MRFNSVAAAGLILTLLLPTGAAIAANGPDESFESAPGQGKNYINNQTYQQGQDQIGQAFGKAAGQCTFSSGLSALLSSFISYLVSSLFASKAEDTVTNILRVPSAIQPSVADATKAVRAKEVCAWAPFGICVFPSLDAIAFCFINEIIHYIGQATIQWIKTGFKGSPAFIDDPEKFFTGAVDTVAGQILNQISGGLLCEPWRAQIQIKLLNERVSSFGNGAQGCRISEVSDRWEQFVDSGQFFSWDLQYAYTQNPYNNPTGSYIEAQNAFNVQLAQVQNGLQVELGWSDGFIHVKDPETGRISTPGRVLESQINRRLGNSENRLLIADEFDEVINTLVNELVKLALSELLSGDGQDSSDSYSGPRFQIGDDTVEVVEEEASTSTAPTIDPDGGTDGKGSNLEVVCSVADATILEGETARVTARVTGAVGTVTYDWDKDFSGSGASATRTFNDGGGYTARVTVSDEDWDGEVEKATCPRIRVSEDYKVSCGVSKASIKPGERVTYTATATGVDGKITDYDWKGSATGRGGVISQKYDTIGLYMTQVKITDSSGNREEAVCPSVRVAR